MKLNIDRVLKDHPTSMTTGQILPLTFLYYADFQFDQTLISYVFTVFIPLISLI